MNPFRINTYHSVTHWLLTLLLAVVHILSCLVLLSTFGFVTLKPVSDRVNVAVNLAALTGLCHNHWTLRLVDNLFTILDMLFNLPMDEDLDSGSQGFLNLTRGYTSCQDCGVLSSYFLADLPFGKFIRLDWDGHFLDRAPVVATTKEK